jgi:hypothetical protein
MQKLVSLDRARDRRPAGEDGVLLPGRTIQSLSSSWSAMM